MQIGNIATEYRKWGLIKFLHSCAMLALGRWLFLCAVDLRPLYAEPKLPKLKPGRSVRVATQQELELLVEEPIYELSKSFIQTALRRGAYCVAAFEDNKIIAYTWRSYSATPHADGLWVEFGPECRYGFKAFTHPDFRRQDLHHTISLMSDADSIRRGCTHSIAFIETHNYPSLLSNAKRGNKRVGYAGYLRVHGRVFPFRTPGAKRHGFRFFVPPTRQ